MKARYMIGMVAVMALFARVSIAQPTEYVSIQSGDWDNPNTWYPPGVPSAEDTATIGCSYTVVVSDVQFITNLFVANGSVGPICGSPGPGQVYIQDGGTLTLTGESNPSATINPSQGILVDDGGRLVATATMTFSGAGSIRIMDGGVFESAQADSTVTFTIPLLLQGALRVSADDAAIATTSTITWESASLEIGPNTGSGTVTFTNSSTIAGSVTIKRNPVNASGVAIFDNQGIVSAQDGAITLDSTLSSISDTGGNCSGAQWIVADSGASLVFAIGADGLTGGFNVGPGTLVINAAVETSGLLRFNSGGAVDIVEDADSFNVTGTGGVGSGNHYCSGSSCSSTAFPFTGDVSCP